MSLIRDVLPRYLRVAVNPSVVPPSVEYFVDDVVSNNVVDSNGSLVRTFNEKIRIPAADHYDKFKLSDFSIVCLLENGVKLDYINAATEHVSLDKIFALSGKLDSLEAYSKLVEKQRSEISDFFSSKIVNSSNLLDHEE